MKATGIVRRIDELGRIVIPKEIRRTLRINEADPMEIFTDHEGSIILKKYSPIGDLGGLAKPFAESLAQVSGHIAVIADRDCYIATSGNGSKSLLGKNISKDMQEKMNAREVICASKDDVNYVSVTEEETHAYEHEVMIPILAGGDMMGAVILLSLDEKKPMSEVEMKLAQSAAGFLGKQIEQ